MYDADKAGKIIVHHVENPDFEVGDVVEGEIDEGRRQQLTMNHTAIHIINGAARKVLGNHVWQAGASKNVDKAHIDITHYKALTDEETERIENMANEIVKKSVPVKKAKMPRPEAEKKYGMRIYQGGVIPENELNIIEIPEFDTEGCGGTHADNTGDIENITILSTERIQDGVVRINIASWKAAERFLSEKKSLIEEVEDILQARGHEVVQEAEKLFKRWKASRKVPKGDAGHLKYKVINNNLVEAVEFAGMKKLQSISKAVSSDDTFVFLIGLSDNVYVFCSAGKNTGLDAGHIVKEACKKLGGSGGGTPLLAQGFGTRKELAEDVKDFVVEYARKKNT